MTKLLDLFYLTSQLALTGFIGISKHVFLKKEKVIEIRQWLKKLSSCE
jgi:hypothetical protein